MTAAHTDPTAPQARRTPIRRTLAALAAPLSRRAETSPRMRRLHAVASLSDAELAARGLTRAQAVRRAVGPGALLL